MAKAGNGTPQKRDACQVLHFFKEE